jgi:hypothetical protein
VNHWREKTLRIDALRTGSLAEGAIAHRRKIPTTYCYTEHLLPRPDDWARYVSVSGFWFLEGADNAGGWTPPEDLKSFLEESKALGQLPVFIGFGSIVVKVHSVPLLSCVCLCLCLPTSFSSSFLLPLPFFGPRLRVCVCFPSFSSYTSIGSFFFSPTHLISQNPDQLTVDVLKAVQLAGRRAIVQKGWAGISQVEIPEGVIGKWSLISLPPPSLPSSSPLSFSYDICLPPSHRSCSS